MTDFSDNIDSFKRSVAPAGTFAALYSTTTDNDVLGSLMDGYAEAQLDGWFITNGQTYASSYTLDVDTGIVTPDLKLPEIRMCVLYAAIQFMHAKLLNLKNRTRFEAKGALAETEQASNVLTATLKSMTSRRDELIQRKRILGLAGAFVMADAYFIAGSSTYLIAGDWTSYENIASPYGGGVQGGPF